MTKLLINSAAIRKKDSIVVDGDLNVVEDALISVIDYETGSYAIIYDPTDKDLLMQNPFTSDDTGQFAFYAPPGIYKIGAVTQTDSFDLEGSVIVDNRGLSVIKTPFDFGAVGDGVNNDLEALTLFFNSVGDGLIPSGVTFYYEGKIAVQNNEKLNVFGGGTLKAKFLDQECIEFVNCPNGKVKGITFDLSLGDASPSTYRNAISVNSQSVGFNFSFNTIKDAPVQAFATFANNTKSNYNTISNSGAAGEVLGGAITHANCSNGEIIGNRTEGCTANVLFVNSTSISTPCNNVKIKDNYVSNTSSNGIRLQPDDADKLSVSNCEVSGNVLYNIARDAIRINGRFHKVSYNSCDWDGVTFDQTNNLINSNYSHGCIFEGNIAKKAGSCINLSYTDTANYELGHHKINNNHSEECNYCVVAFSGEKNYNLSLVGNSSKDNVLRFMDIRDAEGITITGGTHDNITTDFQEGIAIRRGVGVTVEGVTLKDCTDNTIIFRSCEGATASNNTIQSAKRSGIVFAGTVGGVANGNNVLKYGELSASNGILSTIDSENSNAASSNIAVTGNYLKPFNTNSNGVGYQSCRDLIIRDNIGDGVNVIVSQIDPDSSFAPNNTDIIVKDNMQNGSLSPFKSSGVYRQSGNYTMTGTNETIAITPVNFDNAIAFASGSTTATDGASAALRSTLLNGVEIRLVRGAATANMSVDWQVLEVL